MSKNILGRGQGATLLVNKMELTEMTTQKVSGSRFENNYLDLLLEDTELASSKNLNVNVNKGNLNGGSSVVIKDNTTEILDINTTSCDLKAGEYRVGGTALRDKNEELKNKIINGNNNTITNIPSTALANNVVLTDNTQTISGSKTFSGTSNFSGSLNCDGIDSLTTGGSAVIFSAGNSELNATGSVNIVSNTGNTSSSHVRIKDEDTTRVEINSTGLDLKVGSYQVNGSNLNVVSETLQNKNISGAQNSIAGIPDSALSSKVLLTDTTQTISGTKNFTEPPKIDIIKTAPSSSGPSRDLTLPNSQNDTLCGIDSTQTLTNKTLTSPVISTISNNSNTLTLPTSTDVLIGRNTTDTLTNKTLTAPVISTITNNSNTITLPTTEDILLGRDTTDTLTNKTLTSATNSVGDNCLSSNVALKDATNTFSAVNTFSSNIIANDKISIGTTNPFTPLHVEGSTASLNGITSRRLLNTGGLGGVSTEGWIDTIAIFAEERIMTNNGFITTNGTIAVGSDNRIKTNITDLSGGNSLSLLNQLKPKQYTWKDTITRGNEKVYGFIAQEVNTILPCAIKKTAEYIPNIYQKATLNDTILTFENELSLDIITDVSGGKIKIYDKQDKAHYIKVVCSPTNKTILIDEDNEKITDEMLHENQVFVFGERVNDFHTLEKEIIIPVAVSAIQELNKKNEALEKRIEDLEETIMGLIE